MADLPVNSPVGYRFHPNDKEIIGHFLRLKINGFDDQVSIIREVDIYKYEPWELPGLSMIETDDNEWFFFCKLEYQKGRRVKRATKSGFWKSTGNDRVIKSGKKEIGRKKSLVFHSGRGSNAKGTHWKIHEYRATDKALHGTHAGAQGDFVLCRLFKDNHENQDENIESLDCDEIEQILSRYEETQSEPVTPTMGRQAEMQPSSIESCVAENSDTEDASDIEEFLDSILVTDEQFYVNSSSHKILAFEGESNLKNIEREDTLQMETFGPHKTPDITNDEQRGRILVSLQSNSLGQGALDAVSPGDINSGTGIIMRTRQPPAQENDQSFAIHGNAPRRLRLQVNCRFPKDISCSKENWEVKQTEVEGEKTTKKQAATTDETQAKYSGDGEVPQKLRLNLNSKNDFPNSGRTKAHRVLVAVGFSLFVGIWGYLKY